MKKLLTISLLFLFMFSGAFAYSPTSKDTKLLEKIYQKLDTICIKSEKKCESLKNKIDTVLPKYQKNKRVVFLLESISQYLEENLNKENDLLNDLLGDNQEEKEKVQLPKIIVTKVSDGDTIHFEKNGKDYVARLIGIDSPESTETRYGHTEKLGNEATEYLESLIMDKEIQIEYDDTQARTDKYGRHLIYVFYNGENINQKMIESGLAKEYTYDRPYKYQDDFIEAQEEAEKLKKGIWGLENKEEVIKEIENHDVDPKACYIKGNINSKGEKIYHAPGCQSYTKTKISPYKGEMCFSNAKEAVEAGWRMAGNCN